MSPILIAVIIVGAMGLLLGLGLAVASVVMAVPVDEKEVAIRGELPGANCGACGYSGCDAYAAALSSGETEKTNLCIPGGDEVSKKIAEITGLQAGNIKPQAAVVLCRGSYGSCEPKLKYSGVKSCAMAQQLFGGPKSCSYGCIGFGDCVEACPYNAIKICDGVARIDPTVCRACGKCISTCPKNLIEMLPLGVPKASVLCKNIERGAQTRKQCKTGCIGCMKCVKACEYGAVTVENNVARVDYEKCTGCGECSLVCPVKSISLLKLVSKKEILNVNN